MIGIDSDFIIDLLRGNQKAEEKAKEIQDPTFTTTINFFEVMRGVIRHSKKKETAIAGLPGKSEERRNCFQARSKRNIYGVS